MMSRMPSEKFCIAVGNASYAETASMWARYRFSYLPTLDEFLRVGSSANERLLSRTSLEY